MSLTRTSEEGVFRVDLFGKGFRNFTFIRLTLIVNVALATLGCNSKDEDRVSLVVVGPAVHEFGECRQGEVLTHVFTLLNKCSKPIDVVELRTSCGCLVPGGDDGFHDTHIASNGRVQLPVYFGVGERQGTASARVIASYRQLGSEELEHLELRVQTNVLPDYYIIPRELDFGEIDGLADQHVSQVFRVTPGGEVRCGNPRGQVIKQVRHCRNIAEERRRSWF